MQSQAPALRQGPSEASSSPSSSVFLAVHSLPLPPPLSALAHLSSSQHKALPPAPPSTAPPDGILMAMFSN